MRVSSSGVPVATMRPSRRTATRSDELLRLVEVVRRQQDRLAELAQRADRLPRGAPRGGIEAGRRLVEEDQLGVADEREAEVEPPPLSAGQLAHERVRLLLQADDSDHFVDGPRPLVVAGEEREALAHGQVLVHRRGLEDDADPPAPRARRVPGSAPSTETVPPSRRR